VAVSFRVPATSANLGPGFDCLGVAVSLYNTFTLAESEQDVVPTLGDGSPNLAWQAVDRLYRHLDRPRPALTLSQGIEIPLSRGLGSSASAVVGGLSCANAIAGSPLSPDDLLTLATEMEGHPDNVAPALFGGCVLSVGTPPRCARLPWPPDWQLVLAIPDFPLSTAAARAALPGAIPLHDAAFTAGRAALLVAAAHQGRTDWLSVALQDRLHQPYRRGLVRGYDEVETAALAAGAHGLTLSGAGPTLAAWTSPERAAAVGTAMGTAWRSLGVYAEIVTADIDSRGAAPIG
jgi:homoserine kinase